MGNCFKNKAKANEMKTAKSDAVSQKLSAKLSEAQKHTFKEIIRQPNKSSQASTKKTAIKHFPTPQPSIQLKSPYVAAAF